MKIINESLINPVNITQASGGNNIAGEQTSFGQFLQDAMSEVNNLQQQSGNVKQQLLTGNVDDVHQVMIAAEKASVALQLTVQVRNKVIEAYQEIMRMQV